MKDDYTKNPIGDKGSILTKPSLLRDKEQKKSGSIITGTLLEVTEKSFWELRKTLKKIGNFGIIKSPKEAPPDKRSDGQRPGKNIGYPQGYQTGKTSHIARERLEIFADHFGTLSKNVGDIEKENDPQEGSGAFN